MYKIKINKNRLGATLLEIIMVLIITLTAISGAGVFYNDYLNGQVRTAAAQQLREVSGAAHEYVQERYSRLLSQLQPASDIEITSSLKLFNRDLSDYLNPYQQNYRVFVRAVPPGAGVDSSLELFVFTENGERIEEDDAIQVSRMLGAIGGYGKASGEIRSPSGGFALDAPSDYGVTLEPGRLATIVPLSEAQGNDADMLFRNAIAGRANLNQMRTDLDLGGNDMTGIDDLQGDRLEASDALHVPRYNAATEPAFNPAGTRIRADINQIATANANIHHLRTGPNTGPGDTVTGALTASGDGQIDGQTLTRTIYTYGSDIDQRTSTGAPGGNLSTKNMITSGIFEVKSGGQLIQPEVVLGSPCLEKGLVGRTTASGGAYVVCRENKAGNLVWDSSLIARGHSVSSEMDPLNTTPSQFHITLLFNENDFFIQNEQRPFPSSVVPNSDPWWHKELPGVWGACFINSMRVGVEGTRFSNIMQDKIYYEGYANYANPLWPYKQGRLWKGNSQGAMTEYYPESSSSCSVGSIGDGKWSMTLHIPGDLRTEHWCRASCIR